MSVISTLDRNSTCVKSAFAAVSPVYFAMFTSLEPFLLYHLLTIPPKCSAPSYVLSTCEFCTNHVLYLIELAPISSISK